jgi:hypothetical protein
MTAVRIPTAMKVDTKPIVHPSLSIKYLLFIISAVTGLLALNCKPETVGLPYQRSGVYTVLRNKAFTLVNSIQVRMLECLFKYGCIVIKNILIVVGWELVPVSTSGKYPDSALQVPGGNVSPVSYRRSVQGTALRGRCPVSWPIWHSSIFPVALSCKAQTVVSCLL